MAKAAAPAKKRGRAREAKPKAASKGAAPAKKRKMSVFADDSVLPAESEEEEDESEQEEESGEEEEDWAELPVDETLEATDELRKLQEEANAVTAKAKKKGQKYWKCDTCRHKRTGKTHPEKKIDGARARFCAFHPLKTSFKDFNNFTTAADLLAYAAPVCPHCRQQQPSGAAAAGCRLLLAEAATKATAAKARRNPAKWWCSTKDGGAGVSFAVALAKRSTAGRLGQQKKMQTKTAAKAAAKGGAKGGAKAAATTSGGNDSGDDGGVILGGAAASSSRARNAVGAAASSSREGAARNEMNLSDCEQELEALEKNPPWEDEEGAERDDPENDPRGDGRDWRDGAELRKEKTIHEDDGETGEPEDEDL